MIKHFVCGTAILGMAVTNVFAQARIVESEPVTRSRTSAQSSSVPASSRSTGATPSADAGQAELYYQVQLLQQEVQTLRGLIEQQAYELKRLQQQRLEDYLDLDRRIGQLRDSGISASSAQQPAGLDSPSPADAEVETIGSSASGDELASYRAAIDLVLNQRDFDGGIGALNAYLKKFPRGHYVPNAQYWLGQIYLQKKDLAQSKDWFALMIKEYPAHQKTPEAKFKLGMVYHLLGDEAQAKKLLQEVVAQNAAASGLAEDYLKQNF